MELEDLTKLPRQYNFNDKDMCVRKYTAQMLNRLASMFDYSGLEDLIDLRQLERILKTSGAVGIKKIGDKFEILKGGFGGAPDSKYRPTLWIGANPGLKEAQSYSYEVFYGDNEVNENNAVVVITNDTMLEGVLPIINRYSTMLVENDITMKLALIQSRMTKNFITQDDNTALSIKEYIRDIEAGKLGIITTSFLDENEKVFTEAGAANNEITNLIELQQYLKASLYNEFGLNANYNMKRESITAGESQLNFDALLPMVEDMLHCRERAIELLNRLYGTDFKVELHGVWKQLQEAHENSEINGEAVLSPLDEEITETEEQPAEEETTPEEPENASSEVIEEIAEPIAEAIEEVVEAIKEEIEPLEEEEEKDNEISN